MALRKFDDTPAGENPEGMSEEERQRLLGEIKDRLMQGDTSALDGAPEIIQQMGKLIRPMMKAAMTEALDDLITTARRVIREEKEQGQPGPLFQEYIKKIAYYTGIPIEERLQLILVARIVFLLTGAIEALGRDFEIDPHKYDYEDPED